jgi:hypothetical protein
MEPLLLFIGIAAVAFIYNYYSSKIDTENALRQIKKDQKETQAFVSEFQRIAEEYEEAGIPTIESDISLKKGEALHVKLSAIQWMEYRKKRIGNHGLTAKVRITKGLYYRAGQSLSESVDQLTPIDNGDLYFTNIGIFFRGKLGNKNVSYDKIVMLTPFPQGLKIERDTGKDIYVPYAILPKHAAAIVLLWDKVRSQLN